MLKKIFIAIALLMLWAGVSYAATAEQVEFLISGSLKADGSINAAGKVYTCDAGTTCGPATSDPKTTWQDGNKVAAHANPIILDSIGTSVVYADGNYKIQIHDSDDNLVETIDNAFYDVTSGTTLQAQDTLTPSSQTIETTVDTYYCNAQSGNVTTDFSGVSAVGNTGRRYTFKKTDSTLNTCTIDPLSAQTIDGVTTAVLRIQNDDITIESDGSNWLEVRGMLFSRAATFHNTTTFYNAATFKSATFNNTTTFSDTSTFNTDIATFNTNTVFNDISTFNNTVSWSKGADIASAGIINVASVVDGNYFDITGTTNINSISAVGVGTTVKFHFDSAVTLIHNATDLTLPGLANITTNEGDEYEFTEYASGDWRVTGRIINGSPSFSVFRSATQTNVGTSYEKIEFNREEFDTNSDFDIDTNFRFTPTVRGKYLLTAQLEFGVIADDDNLKLAIFKNGANVRETRVSAAGVDPQGINITFVFDANGSTDYFEVFGANETNGADAVDGSSTVTFFGGFRVGQ